MRKQLLALSLALGLASPAAAQSIYYQVGFSNDLFVYDAATNSNTLVGNLGLSSDSTGMAFSSSGTLYLFERQSQSLYTVNTATAATTLVGNAGIGAEDFTISLDGTTGYATANNALYSINLATGAATLISALSTTLDGLTTAPVSVTLGGNSYSAGTVFGVDTGSLFIVDLLGGGLTAIGSTNGASETFDFASDGTLWGQNNGTFYTIDPLTLAGIPDGASAGSSQFAFGMAIAPSATGAVPEPATWAMMLMGFGGIGLSMRRRRRMALA